VTAGRADGGGRATLGSLPRGWRPVAREDLLGDALGVAPYLLNKILVHEGRAGRIVEVEAYRGADDPGSHAYRGMTRRNATMFGRAGSLYVYFTYGMHWCANVVCHADGIPHAVLLRALAPLAGLDDMFAARAAARRPEDLCSGPAKLCQAMGLEGKDDGADLVDGDRGIRLLTDGAPPPEEPSTGLRIGLSAGAEHPWRFWVTGDRNVSRARPGERRGSGRSAPVAGVGAGADPGRMMGRNARGGSGPPPDRRERSSTLVSGR
jgi:DNA-3-methyladenine glycosylase